MSYFVYILQSETDYTYYVGFTSNLEERVNEHNFGSTRYTSKKRPWKLVYQERFSTEREARKRELAIKRKKSRKYIDWLIADQRSG